MTDASITKEKLAEIEESLVKIIVDHYQDGTLSYDDMKKSGQYILSHINVIEHQGQLVTFLKNLSGYWSIFSALTTIESKDSQNQEDQVKIDEITAYIKTLSPHSTN